MRYLTLEDKSFSSETSGSHNIVSVALISGYLVGKANS